MFVDTEAEVQKKPADKREGCIGIRRTHMGVTSVVKRRSSDSLADSACIAVGVAVGAVATAAVTAAATVTEPTRPTMTTSMSPIRFGFRTDVHPMSAEPKSCGESVSGNFLASGKGNGRGGKR